MQLTKRILMLKSEENIAFNRNKIVKLGLAPTTVYIDGRESDAVYYLGENVSTGDFKTPANIFMEGQPIGMFWGYKTNGIYQTEEDATNGTSFNGTPNQAGDVVFVDQDGDGNINELDKTFVGNPNPDFSYGFNLNISYKRFSLSALFSGVYGNEIVNANLAQMGYASSNGTNALKQSYLQAWRTDAPSTTFPRIGWSYYNSQFTDRLVEDGSYLRLNNVTIGYDIPVEKNKAV